MIEIKAEGVEQLVRKFRSMSRRSVRDMERIADRQAERFREEVIARASGRPGPNVVTGDYISRFRIVKRKIFGGFQTSVVNDHPASARLELGFTGVDALGRTYDQPPFPHWRLAEEATTPEFAEDAAKRVRHWWEGR